MMTQSDFWLSLMPFLPWVYRMSFTCVLHGSKSRDAGS
jgi:hypothetical protein